MQSKPSKQLTPTQHPKTTQKVANTINNIPKIIHQQTK